MLNVLALRRKVAKAISVAPTAIEVYRIPKIDNGAGGYTEGTPELVCRCDGLLDNSTSKYLTALVSQGGTVSENTSDLFITTYVEGQPFMKDDYFTVNGQKYVINNPVNVLELNIYWQLSLSKVV
jgi:hypothetical protein